MILSKTPRKIKQINAVSRAREWARVKNLEMCKRAIKEAEEAYPLSEIQWWRLQVIIGTEALKRIRATIGG